MQIEPVERSSQSKLDWHTLDELFACAAAHRCLPAAWATPPSCFLVSTEPSTYACAASHGRPLTLLLPRLRRKVPQPSRSQTCAVAPAADLTDTTAAASSGISSTTGCGSHGHAVAPRVVLLEPPLSPQVPPARQPARHGRQAAQRLARGRRLLRWRRRQRRRARCSLLSAALLESRVRVHVSLRECRRAVACLSAALVRI